jgi:predicted ABC-type exoprotein transport system permease subunit
MDQPSALTQVLSSVGAVLILLAYIGHQMKWKWMDSGRLTYNLLNTVGAAILAYIALRPLQVGFVVLEGTWTLVSIYALYKTLTRRTQAA